MCDKIDYFKWLGNQDFELCVWMVLVFDEIVLLFEDSNFLFVFEIYEMIIWQNELLQFKLMEFFKGLKDIGNFFGGIEFCQFCEVVYGFVCNCCDDWDIVFQECFFKEIEGCVLQVIVKVFQDDLMCQEDLFDQVFL